MAPRPHQGSGNRNNNRPRPQLYSAGCPPLKDVQELEKRTEAAAKEKLKLGPEKQSFALQRPAYGTLGIPAPLWANYVALTPGRGHVFYRYSIGITRTRDKEDNKKQESVKSQEGHSSNNGAVELAAQMADQLTLNSNPTDPDNESGGQAGKDDTIAQPAGMKRAAIIAHLLSNDRDLKERCGRGTIASDYRDNIVSTAPLENLIYTLEYSGVRSDYKLEKYRVALSEPSDVQNPLRMDDLLDHLASDTISNPPVIQEAVFAQVLNIWLRQFSKSKESTEPPTQKVVGSKAYPLNLGFTRSLGSGVMLVRGYFSSIRFGAGKPWVNINVTHGAFFSPIPLTKWIEEARNARCVDSQLHSILKGVRVKLKHRTVERGGKKEDVVKIISGLATSADGRPKDTSQVPPGHHPPEFAPKSPSYGLKCIQIRFFNQSSNKYVTVYDHFREAYPYHPVGKDELVVNLGSALRPAYYPVSVCEIVGGQNYRPKLTDTQTQEMIKWAVLKPSDSVECITKDGFERIGLKHATGSGVSPFAKLLKPASGLASAEGRILAMPSILYGGRALDDSHVNPGKWNLVNAGKFSSHGRDAVWAFLPMGEISWKERPWCSLAENLKSRMIKRGFKFANRQNQPFCLPAEEVPKPLTKPENRTKVVEIFRGLLRKGYNILFVLLPSKDAELYNTIKTAADIQGGIHTVCLVKPKVLNKCWERFDVQFFDNVLLKANLKQGGINHKLKFPTSSILSQWGAMVLGLDVTHSPSGAGGESGFPSIIGMVSNADEHLAQWPATIASQEQENQEIVTEGQSFQKLLEPHLDGYFKKHNRYPPVLILYRDGVSEGQYSHVVNQELTGIRDVCATKYASNRQGPPKISIIVVGKRHHTRFYPASGSQADRNGNTLPGTVVDRSITSQFLWEFYLQAHEAIQGTARPAHYVVVVDEFFRSTFGEQKNRPSSNNGSPYRNAADVLEAFTHALSYALGRSTRSIGVCTPARLADKVCDRARCYTAVGMPLDKIEIANNMKDSMFYI